MDAAIAVLNRPSRRQARGGVAVVVRTGIVGVMVRHIVVLSPVVPAGARGDAQALFASGEARQHLYQQEHDGERLGESVEHV